MKRILFFLFAGAGGLLLGQTNPVSPASAEQKIGLNSDRWFSTARQTVWTGHVVATNQQGTLTCGRFTIFWPPEGAAAGRPDRATAETNVVVHFIRGGHTIRVTGDQAVYDYRVANGVTNQTITFMPSGNIVDEENTNDQMTTWPLIWNINDGTFSGLTNQGVFLLPASGAGSNNVFKLF